MHSILILNGPNLNMLGKREPDIYGTDTLEDIKILCEDVANKLGLTVNFLQSNHEGELITWIQEAKETDKYKGLIINAAAYTHTSIGIHDALKLLDIPIIEVHLSNPKEREDFRHISLIEPVAQQVIAGKGPEGYKIALESLSTHIM